uniref:Uncharacterized protein n=1 Tax=Anguilla anguilla TaxID=7936 RepID=A0A0E9UXK8_ANGAN
MCCYNSKFYLLFIFVSVTPTGSL